MSSTAPHLPIRTCVGCRRRVPAAELLRVVVARDATGEHSGSADAGPAVPTVVPDPRGRAAGRGAWVHPDMQCVENAVRRRAFVRALRASGPLDPTPVCDHLARIDPAGTPVPVTTVLIANVPGDTAP